jgi:exonuclease III
MVNIFCWNYRGLNKPSKRHLLYQNLKLNNIDIVGIQETKMEEIKYHSLLALSSTITHWIVKSSEDNSGGLLVEINIPLFSILHTWILDYSIFIYKIK